MTRAWKWRIAVAGLLGFAVGIPCSLLCTSRVTYLVVCRQCGEAAEQECWFGRVVSVRPSNSRCCQLMRKYFGGNCAHKWEHTGNSTGRNLFGYPLYYACGYHTDAELYWMESLDALERAGRTEDVKLGLRVVSSIGEKSDLKELNFFLRELRCNSESQRKEEKYEDYCARTVRSWAEKFGIEEEGL